MFATNHSDALQAATLKAVQRNAKAKKVVPPPRGQRDNNNNNSNGNNNSNNNNNSGNSAGGNGGATGGTNQFTAAEMATFKECQQTRACYVWNTRDGADSCSKDATARRSSITGADDAVTTNTKSRNAPKSRTTLRHHRHRRRHRHDCRAKARPNPRAQTNKPPRTDNPTRAHSLTLTHTCTHDTHAHRPVHTSRLDNPSGRTHDTQGRVHHNQNPTNNISSHRIRIRASTTPPPTWRSPVRPAPPRTYTRP
jgi:hypothetical protein